MPTDVIMPQMGESIFEGTLTKWLKKPGDKVQRDEPLFEISTDKVDAEIPAPASGVLKEVKVAEGTTVQVNTVVGVIDGDGAGGSTPAKPAAATSAPAAPAKPATTEKASPQADGTPKAAAPAAAPDAPAAARTTAAEGVRTSPLVRRIAKESNLDVGQIPGTGLNGRVTRDDILGFIQKGGKTAAPAPAAPSRAAAAP